MRILFCIAILLMLAGCATKEEERQALWSLCQSNRGYDETTHACDALLLDAGLNRESRGHVRSRLCIIYAEAGQWQQSLEACKKGNDPFTSWRNYNNMGVAYYKLGDTERALWGFTQAINTRSKFYPEGHYNRAIVQESLKRRTAAAADFKVASKGCGTYITIARHHYKALIRFKKL